MSGHGPGFMRGGGPPPDKPKDAKGSFVRLLRLLDADRPQVIAVVAMALVSVGFSVAGPKLLGNATDVVFRGVVAAELPEGVSQEQAVAALRARGEARMADMLAGVEGLVPGQGVDLGCAVSGAADRGRRLRRCSGVRLGAGLHHGRGHPAGDLPAARAGRPQTGPTAVALLRLPPAR